MAKVNALEAFLNADLDVRKKVEIKRLGVELEVRGLGTKEMNAIREQCMFGKKGDELDEDKFNALLVAKSCVSIDFNDEQLREHYGATDAADCVQKALLAGELVSLVQAIMEASGYGDLAELIEAAKN
ncbi:phage tail assembly chaperone [Heyndrickxia coagulans]|uniref:phage tail assembly chaperone n=1 Tax=Heyndrickxia coagulans TaxID=1398 RepID=UPI0007791AF3|nr:hypothetical protein [Heyndrickxia coagulans]KYC67171.1 hypothetical protein B4100_3807 [Heyndrickxia coagulans]